MIIRRVIDATRFLTIIPMGRNATTSEHDLGESLSYFPVTGFIQGLGMAVLAYALLRIMSTSVVSIFILAFYVCITGGFHQDGLSDTFDALSIKSCGDSSTDRERCLKVMKDSTVGPMGVTAVAFTLLMKFTLIESLLHKGFIISAVVLTLLPVVSKWAMVTGMYRTRSAVPGGLGKFFLGQIRTKHVALATIFLCCLAFLSYAFVYMFLHFLNLRLILVLLTQVCFAILINLICKRIFTKKFGGLTGDNFGALHECTEIAYLTLSVVLI